ncbi:general odorant-binding protein 84a isoform X2 [Cryptotermes secundus]|uniref:general odorant-binding protein 84a isoform X2 n=1 Tax=Cryptotermes secundus TaxID=105785 RepID=UPI000CD7D299|nr:general odorant-binding protein 84a isoform X2 [Cryptotermes secundus]
MTHRKRSAHNNEAFASGYDSVLTDIRNQCNETFPISDEYDVRLLNFGSFPDESDKTPMCFIHCFMDKGGMIDTDGTFQQKILVEKLQGFPNDTIIPDLGEIMDHCVTRNGEQADLCERAYNFAKCLIIEEIQRHEETGKEE